MPPRRWKRNQVDVIDDASNEDESEIRKRVEECLLAVDYTLLYESWYVGIIYVVGFGLVDLLDLFYQFGWAAWTGAPAAQVNEAGARALFRLVVILAFMVAGIWFFYKRIRYRRYVALQVDNAIQRAKDMV